MKKAIIVILFLLLAATAWAGCKTIWICDDKGVCKHIQICDY
uniref:Lipoprotein n=1 Tax=viral metagenome TaxID=1070528 RepID=A0A6M3LRL7_9ZZZZ